MDTSIRIVDVVMTFAVLLGPILAVQTQRFLERRRDRHEGKLKVFRTLMATRTRKLDANHVEALNLVSIEFYDNKSVRSAWGEYIDHLNTPATANEAWTHKMDDLFVDLLGRMALSLNYDFDKVQLKRQGYSPTYSSNLDNDQALIRKGLVDVFAGRASIPIHVSGSSHLAAEVPGPLTVAPQDANELRKV